MKMVRVVIEYREEGADKAAMRWERESALGKDNTFELLGRAFEVAQREEGVAFADALLAFFRGALIAHEDVAEVLPKAK